jgi:sterol desaturase/sphingolipid hydroxylase (fatty acid hydroxylase superfamily)
MIRYATNPPAVHHRPARPRPWLASALYALEAAARLLSVALFVLGALPLVAGSVVFAAALAAAMLVGLVLAAPVLLLQALLGVSAGPRIEAECRPVPWHADDDEEE